MKQFKSYILFVWMALVAVGCTYDDLKDEMDELDGRVTLIEEQIKILNDNVTVMDYILDPQNKTINSVRTTGTGENAQHVIILSDGTELILTVGKPGTIKEPEITVGEDNYWYINGESTGVSAVGTDGKNGDGYPEFRVDVGKWQVRFGSGAWNDVPGGETGGTDALGDQIFESAVVEGDYFVITLKSGAIYTLPIVSDLVCILDKDALVFTDGYLALEKDTRVIVDVKIKGENAQITYPQGWRAVLIAKEKADEKGNTHTLYIYTPSTNVGATTRATADNAEDVTVCVQKGMFWAMDKIRVKIGTSAEPGQADNMDKYENDETLIIGGLEISKSKYGAVKSLPGDKIIVEGGVYFVEDGENLQLNMAAITDLFILPKTDAAKVSLTINSQAKLASTLVCQNVDFVNNVNNDYSLIAAGEDMNFIFDNCKITGLKEGFGLMKKDDTAPVSISNFYLVNSDVIVNCNGSITLLEKIDIVTNLTVDNTLIYNSDEGKLTAPFKILNVATAFNIKTVTLLNNTFIDVTPSSTSYSGFIAGPTAKGSYSMAESLNVSNNLHFKSDIANTKAVYLITQLETGYMLVGEHNYRNTTSNNYAVIQGITKIEETANLFDTSDGAIFDKAKGLFIPVSAYQAYGAKRSIQN